MRSTVSCCYQCTKRTSDCHTYCEYYKAEVKEYNQAKAEVMKKHNMDRAIDNAMVENKRRVRKSAHVKK